MALKQKGERPARGADIDCLPEPVKHQHMLVENRTHNGSNCAKTTQNPPEVNAGREFRAICNRLPRLLCRRIIGGGKEFGLYTGGNRERPARFGFGGFASCL